MSKTILLGLQVCGESAFLSICKLYFSISTVQYIPLPSISLLAQHYRSSLTLCLGHFLPWSLFLDTIFLLFSVVSFHQLKILFMATAFV